jgi:hypothetical protein
MNMAVTLVDCTGFEGGTDISLVGMEDEDDFDLLVKAFGYAVGVELVCNLTGIYSNIATFCATDLEFRLVFHEDVGIYLSVADETPEKLERLRILVKTALGTLGR